MAVPQAFAILDLSTPDLLIILAVVLLLFGAKKLPELSKSIGQSARELRKGLNGDEQENKQSARQETSEN
jgi:sec-independent protein translocase protein TatA